MSFFTKSENVKFGSSRRLSDNQTMRHTLNRLRLISEGLASSLGVRDLPIPKLDSLSDVKEFCSGLLINPLEHPWGGAFPCRRKRMSAAHSLFLFRKVIPSVEDPVEMSRDYVIKMTTPQEETSESLLAFARSEVRRIFSPGWDRSYTEACESVTLSTKACIENPRGLGGARGDPGRTFIIRNGKKIFTSTPTDETRLLAKGVREMTGEHEVHVCTIQTGGKYRTITKSSLFQTALKPLHNILYNRLSKEKWLLRGDALPCRFRGFEKKEGEVFVSGDYESATDNIKIDLYRTILDTLEECSPNIPSSVFEHAKAYSRCNLVYENLKEGIRISGKLRRGQLMGNFLSFPILCLINFIVFKYSVPRDVPVKINGDDIVFRATPYEYECWEREVGLSGLKLSKGKTMVDDVFFTLNSTMFQSRVSKVVSVPFVRSKAFFKNPETGFSLKGQFESIVSGWNGRIRQEWQQKFLSRVGVQRTIRVCQRSLVRGLGIKVTPRVLRLSGLYQWERYYSGLPTEPPLPAYSESGGLRCKPVPGFKIFHKKELSRRQLKKAPEVNLSFHRACQFHSKYQVFEDTKDITAVRKGTVRMISLGKGLRSSLRRLYRVFARGRKVYPDLVKFERTGVSWMLPYQKSEYLPRPGLGYNTSDQPIFDDV